MSDYILEMNHITKEFPGVKALNDVNFKVKRGEIHCLVGENGAGKSTLMKVLSGVHHYGTYSGDIVYKGTLFANYPSTDPENFLQSVEKTAELPIKRILPAHHSLDLRTDKVSEIRDELKKLKEKGLLRHGSGLFDYGEWQILL